MVYTYIDQDAQNITFIILEGREPPKMILSISRQVKLNLIQVEGNAIIQLQAIICRKMGI